MRYRAVDREQQKAQAKIKKKKSLFLPSPSETCVYWKIFTAEKGEIAGLISTEKAGIDGRCLWIYINPKDPATTMCFASCTLRVRVVLTTAPLPLPMPPPSLDFNLHPFKNFCHHGNMTQTFKNIF